MQARSTERANRLTTLTKRLVDANKTLYDAAADRSERCRHLRWLRVRFADAQIIALVNFPRQDEVDEARRAGCDRVLGKPFAVSDLLACLAPRPSGLDHSPG